MYPTNITTTQDKPSTNSVGAQPVYKKTLPLGYKWNLPPHDWSLPLRPTDVDPARVYNSGASDFHALRRGRIWFWYTANAVQNFVGGTVKSADPTKITDAGAVDYNTDREWGFQFLWNPETIQSSVARNMDVTPSSADSLRVVSGAFPGQETFSVTIVLDRVNDFACARGTGVILDANGTVLNTNLNQYKKYYSSPEYTQANTDISFSEKLNKVLNQGTMADLEYLFRAINGTLNLKGVSKEWTNLMDKKTSNLGYLQPSLMGFQFGPTLDNLAWVGWISNLSINHIMFTEAMVPIRTEVTISAEAFTGSGVSAS